MHGSDYFAGMCPCNDFPCKRAVEAQEKLEAEERVRMAVYRVYMKFHKRYPQGDFLTQVIEAVRDPHPYPCLFGGRWASGNNCGTCSGCRASAGKPICAVNQRCNECEWCKPRAP